VSVCQKISTQLLILIAVCVAAVAGCRDDKAHNAASADAQTRRENANTAELASDEIVALRNQAAGRMGQFAFDPAVADYERLLAAEPSASDAKVNLAIALLNRRMEGDLDRASVLLDQVARADATNLRALYCRGLIAYHNGDTELARERFAAVADRDKDDAYAIYFLGQCLFAERRYDDALREFQRAQQADPYLRSAYYGAFQAAQRAGAQSLARESLAMFQRLADNPRARVAELKYTRMGPKAEIDLPRGTGLAAAARPHGPEFVELIDLPIAGGNGAKFMARRDATMATSVTVADINGDGHSDLFIAGAVEIPDGIGNAVLLRDEASYRVEPDHPLASIPRVNAALWGDYDNNGLVDVYLCRTGSNQLWRQASPGEWVDITALAGADGGNLNTVDGAVFDADHDGDLDYFLVSSDGPNDLLNNDRNGAFRSIATLQGLTGSGRGSRQVVIADLDADDDADIIVVNAAPPHDVYINDRLWNYRPGSELDEFSSSVIDAVVALDSDVDGQCELYAVGDGELVRWTRQEDGSWQSKRLADVGPNTTSDGTVLAIEDFDGDSQPEFMLQQGNQLRFLAPDGELRQETTIPGIAGNVGILVADRGPEIVAARRNGPPVMLPAGDGRFPFVLLRLQGQDDKGADMRTNASGIGVKAWARIGERWAAIAPVRAGSGPGQSLQPAAVGIGGNEKIDFLRLVWPDGVSQSELDLRPGQLHTIGEVQRQTGSCPLVFIWNGEQFEFVADVLGAGGLGVNLGNGEYFEPRPEENLLLPADRMQPLNGNYAVKLGEPMEELSYIDAVRLATYDLPEGVRMALDERLRGAAPMPTGEPIYYRQEILPRRVVNGHGGDVMEAMLEADRVAVSFERRDRRFIGLTEPHQVILEFAERLDRLKSPVLIFDGWVEYAYSQTAFAMWQSGTRFLMPTIEARGADGRWHVVVEHFGYMAGTSRRSAMPLDRSRLPPDTRELRLSTNMQIYWDRVAVVERETCPSARRNELQLVKAEVADVGFTRRKALNQRCASYDYSQRPPLADARHPVGWYTAFGDARELVVAADNALAIIGPGEELHLEFAAGEACPAGYERSFVLESNGWCKDTDLLTRDSGTVEPLPMQAGLATPDKDARRLRLHRTFNTRFMAGW
jgi:tetratricopeptide (TPR) repeat protein